MSTRASWSTLLRMILSVINGSCMSGMISSSPHLRHRTTNIYPSRDAERDQTRTGVSRIMNWAVTTGSLGDEDLLISASVDEVMSRQALHQLRWCHLANDVVFGGLWMPMGNLQKVKYEARDDSESDTDGSFQGTSC